MQKIASGGEISRVMLALKTIFAKTDNINTVIFDEIDTGISGNACQAVAQTIKELAKNSPDYINNTPAYNCRKIRQTFLCGKKLRRVKPV